MGILEENNFNIEDLEIFPWNESFETGILEIDDQHKKLIQLLNQLARTLTQNGTHEIENTFAELAQYANYHFESEEKIWEKHIQDKALVQAHNESHTSFLPKVLEIQEKNKDKDYHEIVEEILLFLVRWLAFHIIDEDKRLSLIIQSLKEGKTNQEASYIADTLMNSSMKNLIHAILSMYDNLSIKAIKLIRERQARIKAQKELKEINKKLEQLSITDQLTGIYNRRFFEQVFNQELKRAQRNQTPFAVILLDIDYFKNLNDTYGHAKGDLALKSVANCIQSLCKRPHDFVFRVGGEEFCIITCEDDNAVYHLAQIIHTGINDLNIENINSKIEDFLTVSMGVVCKVPNLEDDIDNIMKIVDSRLYEAKEKGRNTIV